MPKDLTDSFKQQKNKVANKPIYLYKVFDYNDEGEDLLFAEWGENITFDSEVYQAYPIKHDEIGENSSGEVDAIKVRISNVSRTIQGYLEHYDFGGKKVLVRMVWADRLAFPEDKIDTIYYVDSYTANDASAEFLLMPKMIVVEAQLPARTFKRNTCSWVFKSDECGYAGAETTCNKTRVRCRELDNQTRFGATPGIPQRRVYLYV